MIPSASILRQNVEIGHGFMILIPRQDAFVSIIFNVVSDLSIGLN